MKFFRQNRWLRAFLAGLYVIVAAAVGYAHHAPAAAQELSSTLELFRLPDGSLPDFCLSTHGKQDGTHDRADNFPSCDACRLTHQPGLGAIVPAEFILPELNTIWAFPHRFDRVATAPFARPNARGPPAFPIYRM
jgi:hypothetical protein